MGHQDELPTILFIPSVWIERAFDATVRTGQPVEVFFYQTKINRRSFERRQMNRSADRRASLLDLLDTNGQDENSSPRVLAAC